MELKLQSRNQRQGVLKKIIYALHKISVKNILYLSLIFFISMAQIPFLQSASGCAIFAAEYFGVPSAPVAIIVLIAGFFGKRSPFQLMQSALAMLIFSAGAAKNKLDSPFKKGILITAATFFCNIVPKLFSSLYLYDTLMLILDALIIFSLTVLFHKAKVFFWAPKENVNNLLPFAVFMAAAVMGVSSFSVNEINIGVFICMLLTLLFVYKNGFSASPVGIIIGVALGISLDSFSYYVTLFAISAFAAGIFSPLGKGCSALSFVLTSAFTAFYSPSSLDGVLNITLSSVSAMIFMLLPQKLTSPFAIIKTDAQNSALHFKEYVLKQLSDSAAVMSDIANSFEELCRETASNESLASLSFFERATSMLCSECAHKKRCWKNEFHRTYTSFFVLIEICNKNGSISYCDIPEELIKKCTNAHSIASSFNTMYDIYKVDRLWECRTLEMRSAFASQLKCISSSLLKKVENSAVNSFFMPLKEKQLKKSFENEDIKTEKIFVCGNKNGTVTFYIHFENTPDVALAEKICTAAFNSPCKCIYSHENVMHFSLFPSHKAETFIAGKASGKGIQNGDSAAFSYINNDKYAVILSDGMGCGHTAGKHSSIAANLALKMLKCGFDEKDTLNIINTALLLKSSETSFSTLDMAVINLTSSVVDFYKMGAAPAFIKNGKNVKTILAATLPAGSFLKSDIGHISHKLSEGDNIILLSDGIANGENTAELEKIICKFTGGGSALVDMILSYSLNLSETPPDDMTVTVTCIK